jgi:hypothetical protein
MAGLADLRAKYPEYNDLSDQQLADGFYKKYYSDMPRAQFDQKMGLAMSPAERFDEAAPGAADPNAPRPGLQAATSAAADTEGQRQYARDFSFLGLTTKPSEFEKSLGTGIVRLPARMIGAYKDITETAGAAAGGIAEWLGASDETAKGIHDTVTGAAANVPVLGSLPSSEQVLEVAGNVNKAASEATGIDLGLHQPQGKAGAAGELVAGFLGGPKLPAQAAERAAVAATAPVAGTVRAVPPVPEGSVRFYHGHSGSSDPASGGARWLTPDENYARNWGTGGEVSYVDIPRERVPPNGYDEINNYPQSFEAPEEIAQQLKPLTSTPTASTAAPATAKTAAPTLPEMGANTTAAYNAARDAGITVKARPFSRVLDDTINAAEKEGNDFIAKAGKKGDFPRVNRLEKAFDDLSKRGDDWTFEEVDRVRRKFNKAFSKTTDADERRILTVMRNKFDEGIDAMTPGGDYTASNMAPEEAAKLWKDARTTKTAEETAKSVEKAFGGDKTAAQIQKQAQKWIDDPKRMKRLKPEEQDLVREIANVSGPEKMANLVSRITGGPLGSFLSLHFLGPVGAAPAVANVAKAGYAFQRGKRAEALRDIVRGYGPEPTPATAAVAPPAIPEPAGMPPPQLPPATSPPVPWLAIGAGDRPQRQPPP